MFLKFPEILFATALIALPGWLGAAPQNDNCSQAILLRNVSGWCSAPRQYSNQNATPSGFQNPECFPSYLLENDNDVWFKFTAIANTVNISVIGAVGGNPKGTLHFPQFALYQGSCGDLRYVACISDGLGYNITETFVNSLVIGETYFLRVAARNNSTGTFQLCVNNYNPVPSPSSDCASAVVLCDKSPFTVPSVMGVGRNAHELGNICVPTESSSAWYKWTCEKSGSLTFTLKPVNPADDLDFALFLLPNGVEDCSLKIPLRCMASGENVNQPFVLWAKCAGATGLRNSSADFMEGEGCDEGNDNFLAALSMEAGKSYALVVNNYHNTGNGFSIEFGGPGTFAGPQAHFTVNKLKIVEGQDFFAKDASNFSGGINKWQWNFGVGASPQTATGRGPHKVIYKKQGKKSISLAIETSNGCQVTKVRHIQVLPPPPEPKEESVVVEQKVEHTVPSLREKEKAGTPPLPVRREEVQDAPATQPTAPDTTRTSVSFDVKYHAIVYFVADSFSLDADDFEVLAEVLDILRSNPDYQAIVEGRANSIPSDEYIKKLASARSEAVIGYLTRRGIGEERIILKVFGKKDWIQKDYSLQRRRIDQRVDVKLVKRKE
jgi:outer membrane protein OmpA-like peptidoglycan-associated protein